MSWPASELIESKRGVLIDDDATGRDQGASLAATRAFAGSQVLLLDVKSCRVEADHEAVQLGVDVCVLCRVMRRRSSSTVGATVFNLVEIILVVRVNMVQRTAV